MTQRKPNNQRVFYTSLPSELLIYFLQLMQEYTDMSKEFDPTNTDFLNHIREVTDEDTKGLRVAFAQYGPSWKQRGGVGAFMMLARKWDRIENRLKEIPSKNNKAGSTDPLVGDRWDIFKHLEFDDRGEGLIDDIRDLRRYLVLVEAEARARGFPCAQAVHRDNEERDGTYDG